MNNFLPIQKIINAQNLPKANIILDMYNLMSDPVKVLIMFYLIDRGKCPILAIDRELANLYTRYSLTTGQVKQVNKYAGKILSSILEGFCLAPRPSAQRIHSETNGLMTTSRTYFDFIPNTTRTTNSQGQVLSKYPNPLMTLDVRNLKFIAPVINPQTGRYLKSI